MSMIIILTYAYIHKLQQQPKLGVIWKKSGSKSASNLENQWTSNSKLFLLGLTFFYGHKLRAFRFMLVLKGNFLWDP